MSFSPPLKRRRITLEKSISPPPIKRKLTDGPVVTTAAFHSSSATSSSVPNTRDGTQQTDNQINSRFEVISWNVNGVAHLLPPSNQNITSFFAHKAAVAGRNAVDVVTDSESASDVKAGLTSTCYHDQSKKDRIFRITKGINEETQNGSPIRAFLQRHNFPQIVCFQEVKISPSDEGLKTRFERAVNGGMSLSRNETDTGHRYEISYSLPRDRFNARGPGGKGKVYGVCTLVRRDLFNLQNMDLPAHHKGHDFDEADTATRLKTRSDTGPRDEIDSGNTIASHPAPWDLEGRVLITTLPPFNLAIINGYWVNGTSNPWREASTGSIIGTRHDAKREFHKQMLREAQTHEQAGWDVLLIGDMNVARDARDGHPGLRLGTEHVKNREDFNGKFFGEGEGKWKGNGAGSLGGVDTFRYVHGDRRGYTYHGERAGEWGKSCDRVDLGIVSRGVVEKGALVGAEIWESVVERGGSDHVPIGVVLDVGLLEARGGGLGNMRLGKKMD